MIPRQQRRVQAKPFVTALVAGGLAGLVAILTYQAMMALQRLIWNTGAGEDGPGATRIVVTILVGGALLLLLARVAPSESMEELLDDANHPAGRSQRKILVTALVAIVSIAFGGAVGPEAGLLAVVAQCSVLVSRRVAQDEAQARAIAQAGTAGALGGIYGAPPVAAAMEDDRADAGTAPSRLLQFVAGLSGFAVFLGLARTVFGGEGVARIPLPDTIDGAEWLLILPLLAGAGAGLAFVWLHRAVDSVAARFSRRWVVTVVGTVAFAALAAAVPLLRFSGHHELAELPSLYASGDAGLLWVLVIGKVAATVLCLVAGWRGGEIFPLIFIGAAAGAAVAAAVPQIDPAAAMAGAMAATLTVGWRKPLAGFVVLLIVIEAPLAIPLLAGVGVGIVVDRVLGATDDGEGTRDPREAAVPSPDGGARS